MSFAETFGLSVEISIFKEAAEFLHCRIGQSFRILAREDTSMAFTGLVEVTKKGECPRVPSELSRHFVYSPPWPATMPAMTTGLSLSLSLFLPVFLSLSLSGAGIAIQLVSKPDPFLTSTTVAVNLLRKVEKL